MAGPSTTLNLLDESLNIVSRVTNQVIQNRLLASAAQDIDELRPQLEPRAEEFADDAKRRLAERGEREAESLRRTLITQRDRVAAELERHEKDYRQLAFGFAQDEIRELHANNRHWRIRLGQFDRDIEAEPDRIREFYKVRAQRIEPIGLVYLWPETN